MRKELGSLLKNAFLSRKSGKASSDQTGAMLKPGERRDVAVLFLDLAGFTAFSETLDHETVHDITKSLMDELVFTADQYSGYVDKIEGDRIMVLFGAIHSGENNSRSAVLSAFKMLEVVKIASYILTEAGAIISARIGINSGPVTVAPDAIGHLTAMGNTVNIASRIEEIAAENSILVTDRVYSLCSEDILWENSREVSIRGIGIPLLTWKPLVVKYRGNTISCHESINTVFVGREKEYSILVETRKMQLDHTSGYNRMGGARHLIVELTGEAGTGKTRLITEFLKNEYLTTDSIILRSNSISDAQPAHWLWSVVLRNLFNFQIEDSIAYDDFTYAVSRHCPVNKLSTALPFLGRLVSAISSDSRLQELDNKAIVTETEMAIRDLLEALSESSPVVIVLEDLQWMDSTDSRVLDFIVKNCNSVNPIMFLLVRRSDHKNLLPEDICDNSAYSISRRIEIRELGEDESLLFTERFMRKLNGDKSNPISTAAMDFIQRHSSGNPFFLQELLLHLVESGGLSLTDSSWSLTDDSVEFSTPGSLTGLLQSRLDRLPDSLRKTLLNCSVLGMEFRLDIYKRVEEKLGIPLCGEDVFNGLIERQFLECSSSPEQTIYRFRHSFIQDTAYRSILAHNLKLLHKAAAESMEDLFDDNDERVSAKLADHWERAGEESSAVRWGIIAHRHASKNYQYDSVLKRGDKLDKWLSPHGDNPEALQKLLQVIKRNCMALQLTCRWEELHILLERMLSIASSNYLTKWVARTEVAMGSYYTAVRDLDSALMHLDKSLKLSRENDFAEIESEALGSLGVIAAMNREFSRARKFFELERDLFSDLQNLSGKAKALGNLGILHRNIGETDKAIPLLEETLEIFRSTGDVRGEAVTLGNLGSLYQDQDSTDKAEDFYRRAIDIFHRLGDRMPEAVFLCNLGNVFRNRKNFSQARNSYFKARDIMEEISDKRTEAWIMTNLGLLFIVEGNPGESEKLYTNAVRMFIEVEDEENKAIALAGAGYVQYLSGRHNMALKTLKTTHEIISRLKLESEEFSETFIKLHRKLGDIGTNAKDLPWPEHWDISEQ